MQWLICIWFTSTLYTSLFLYASPGGFRGIFSSVRFGGNFRSVRFSGTFGVYINRIPASTYCLYSCSSNNRAPTLASQ